MSEKFEFFKTLLKDLYLIIPKVHRDNRGHFVELYNRKDFKEIGLRDSFVQHNESESRKGVLRGLHFQRNQAKLVWVTKGRVFDVAVDLRKDSITYGEWKGFFLSENNKTMVYIPEGFAHGFLVLSEVARVNYLCTELYNPEEEGGVLWSDPDLNINWNNHLKPSIISERDKKFGYLKDL